MAIEIRNFITREFEANLQVLKSLTSSSVAALAKTICEKSKKVAWKVREKGNESGVADVGGIPVSALHILFSCL